MGLARFVNRVARKLRAFARAWLDGLSTSVPGSHPGGNSGAGVRKSCDFPGAASTKIQQRRFRSC
jgi:hypothetical protein